MIDRLGGLFGSQDAEEDFDDSDVEDYGADVEPLPGPVGQDERRMQVRAYNHWASLLGDRNFPQIDDLEPETLEDFGPYSVLLDLSGDVEDPQLRYVGSELREECAHEGDLDQLSGVPSRSVLSRITDHYMQILANQAPIGFEAEFDNAAGATVLYRGILLPYSSDDETIDFIYGVINWKEMADQETADALLLELDQALGHGDDDEPAYREAPETAQSFARSARNDADDYDVLELGSAEMMDHGGAEDLPHPAFGPVDASDEHEGPSSPAPLAARLDALGNPIGGHAMHSFDEDEDDFDGGMKTAADYGLPDWDGEDEDEDDVEGVVNPLADEDASSSLVALVNRGDRTKKSVDLSLAEAVPGHDTAPLPRIPEAYEPPALPVEPEPEEAEGEDRYASLAAVDLPDPAHSDDEDANENEYEEALELQTLAADGDEAEHEDVSAEAGEGLYDSLAAAREMALAAQSTEDRSRKTLYEAVGRAYDFSLEAQNDPAGFDELLVDNGLTIQDRAPMTPVVKLVFGVDYDKTRLTEYAAVLMHGHRVGVERGGLASFLREAEGGLKGVVQAERRARKEEQGKPAEDRDGVRAKLAKQLRALDAQAFDDLEEEGAEFALVMVRRTEDGAIEILGEVPEDIALVERAARKLLG